MDIKKSNSASGKKNNTKNSNTPVGKKAGWGKLAIRIIAVLATVFIIVPWLIVKLIPNNRQSGGKKTLFADRLVATEAESTAKTLFGMKNPGSDCLAVYEAMTELSMVKEEYGEFTLSLSDDGKDLQFSFAAGHDGSMDDGFSNGLLKNGMLLLALSETLDSVKWIFPEGSENEDIGWTRKDADIFFTDAIKADNKLMDYAESAEGIQLLMNEFGICS